jgi:creatinine amidohydrolase/Fe(II)-dependent formamide hydrolase-like protein
VSGTWGDARDATPEFGRRYLDVVVDATEQLIRDVRRTHEAMPPR